MIRRLLSRFNMTPAPDASSGAGSADMIPADLQARFSKALLGELREQKGHDVGNGLYESIIVSFVFNHERIEGNATSEVDTRTIFETRDIVLEDDSISSDVRETANHTLMFDYLIDTIDEALIRGLHRSLMQGVMKTPGEWKVNPNGVGGVSTVRPCDVPEAIDALLASYGRHQATLDNITRFHVRYETMFWSSVVLPGNPTAVADGPGLSLGRLAGARDLVPRRRVGGVVAVSHHRWPPFRLSAGRMERDADAPRYRC